MLKRKHGSACKRVCMGSCARRRCSGQPAGLGELGWGSRGPSPTLSPGSEDTEARRRPAGRGLKGRLTPRSECGHSAIAHTRWGVPVDWLPGFPPGPAPVSPYVLMEVYLQPWLACANDSPSRLSKECFMPGTSQGPQHMNDRLGLQSRTGGLGRAVPLPSLSVPAPRGGAQVEDRENRGSFWGQRFQISQHPTLVMSRMENYCVHGRLFKGEGSIC